MTTEFRVVWSEGAIRVLRKLDRSVAKRLVTATKLLAQDPYPPRSKKMKGFPDLSRVRVGDFRIVYRVKDARLIVTVVKIGHRRDVYRGLKG